MLFYLRLNALYVAIMLVLFWQWIFKMINGSLCTVEIAYYFVLLSQRSFEAHALFYLLFSYVKFTPNVVVYVVGLSKFSCHVYLLSCF